MRLTFCVEGWKHVVLQIKARHQARIAPEAEAAADTTVAKPQLTHPELVLDTLASAKYEELRNMEAFNASVNDYLLALLWRCHK